jgi:hypothetical protein
MIATADNPVTVRRSRRTMDRGKLTFVWECRACKVRGYHRSDRFTDKYRASLGKPPDLHPWERAMAAAARHLHQKHTACPCCADRHEPRSRVVG